MPQARSSGSGAGSSSGSSSGRSQTRRSTGGRSTGTRRTTGSSSGGATSARSTRARSTRARAAASSSSASAGSAQTATAPDARLEAVAQRVRKLNERIIEAGKEAGEATLSSYEKALKAIASTLERGPGRSDVEWISALATTQAKFIRDVTNAWTSAARGMLK
jgi:hypothetical protein